MWFSFSSLTSASGSPKVRLEGVCGGGGLDPVLDGLLSLPGPGHGDETIPGTITGLVITIALLYLLDMGISD